MYGFRLEITRPGMDHGTRGIKRVEFDAPGPRTAGDMIDGWAAVEGVTVVKRELIADGCTFLEAGKRRIVGMARTLAREFGGEIVGPFGIGHDGAPGYGVRVVMPNMYGVSILTGGSGAYDPAPVVQFLTVHDDDTDVTWGGFPGAMGDSRRGDDGCDDRADLEEIRAAMRMLPQP